jgi:hypothetical protein
MSKEITREKDLETRTKRAQAVVAMGLIQRAGDRFLVGVRSQAGKPGQHEVWRDEAGKVRCTCEEFAAAAQADPNFRCEHILAVKLSLAPVAAEDKTALVTSGAEAAREQSPSVGKGWPGQSASPAPFREVLSRLSEPIPGKLIKQREGWRDHFGTVHYVDYIEWHTVADLLDQAAPDWSHAVRAVTQIGDLIAVTASITINGVTREGIGTGSAESETGIKKAEHDALKRAAVKFGVARDLYKDTGDEDGAADHLPPSPSLPRDPLAKTLAELVTPKQLVAIRAIAHAQELQAEDECAALFGCKLEELSRRAASALIDHLKARQQAEAEQLRRAV